WPWISSSARAPVLAVVTWYPRLTSVSSKSERILSSSSTTSTFDRSGIARDRSAALVRSRGQLGRGRVGEREGLGHGLAGPRHHGDRAGALGRDPGDAPPEPPVDDGPERWRDRQHDLALDLAERHHPQARRELVGDEPADQRPELGLGGGRQVGHRVEVDEL